MHVSCYCCHLTFTFLFTFPLHFHFAFSGLLAAAGAFSWMHPCSLSSLHCLASDSSFPPLSLEMRTFWHQFLHIELQVHVQLLPFLSSPCFPLLGWGPTWALPVPPSLACGPVPGPVSFFFLLGSRVLALVWKMLNAWILAPIVVIDVHFYFNLAAILE